MFRWPSLIFWSGRSRSQEKSAEMQKEKEQGPQQQQQPPNQRPILSQSVVNLPKMVHFSAASTTSTTLGSARHPMPANHYHQVQSYPKPSPYTSSIQHWLLSREPVYYAVPAAVVTTTTSGDGGQLPLTAISSLSTPNLRATILDESGATGGRSHSLPPKKPSAAGGGRRQQPPPLVISPLVYRLAKPTVDCGQVKVTSAKKVCPPTPPPRSARAVRRGSLRSGASASGYRHNQHGQNQNLQQNVRMVASDLLLLRKLHTRLAQLPPPSEVNNRRLQATLLRVEQTLKRMQQVVWFTNDPFIITRIVPVSPHCFDHHQPAAEEGRLALFIVVLDLVSSADYLAAFHHMLVSAYGGQLGLPVHLLDQIKLVAASTEDDGELGPSCGGYIELPSYIDASGGSLSSSNSGGASSQPPVLVRIRLTLEWASFIGGGGHRGHQQQQQSLHQQKLSTITDQMQKRAILANWVIVKRVQWYGRLLKRGGSSSGLSSLLLVQLLQDIRRRFGVLRLLTPWKLTLLGEYFGRSGENAQPIPLDVAFRRFFEAAAGNLFQQPSSGHFNSQTADFSPSSIPASLSVCITASMADEVQVELQLAFFILNFLLQKWEVRGKGEREGSTAQWSNGLPSSGRRPSCSPTGADIVLGLEEATSSLPTNLLALLRCTATD